MDIVVNDGRKSAFFLFQEVAIKRVYTDFFIFKTTFKGWCDLCSGATFLWFSTQPKTAEKNLEWALPSVT